MLVFADVTYLTDITDNVENGNSSAGIIVFLKRTKEKEKERKFLHLVEFQLVTVAITDLRESQYFTPAEKIYRHTATRDGMQMLLPFFVRFEMAESSGGSKFK